MMESTEAVVGANAIRNRQLKLKKKANKQAAYAAKRLRETENSNAQQLVNAYAAVGVAEPLEIQSTSIADTAEVDELLDIDQNIAGFAAIDEANLFEGDADQVKVRFPDEFTAPEATTVFESDAKATEGPIHDLTTTESIDAIAKAPDEDADEVGQPSRPRRPHHKGRRPLKKTNNKGKSKFWTELEGNTEELEDFENAGFHRQGHQRTSTPSHFIDGQRNASAAGYDGANELNMDQVNTLLPSRISRMAPVVLPNLSLLFKTPTTFTSESMKIPEQPSKTTKEFAKDIPKMTEDLNRVIEKQDQLALVAEAKKRADMIDDPSITGEDNSEGSITETDEPAGTVSEKDEPTESGATKKRKNRKRKNKKKKKHPNMVIFRPEDGVPAITQSLPATPGDRLTYAEWKELPASKRYAPLKYKEKLAIKSMEMLPQFLAEEDAKNASQQASDVHTPARESLMERMQFHFARSMAYARVEALNGQFDWSTQEEAAGREPNPDLLERCDIMSRAQSEAFTTGMQEVTDPDRDGLVIMRRYWRITSGLKPGDGVGGVIAACLREEKYLGRPSFKLRASQGGVDAVLICEVQVDKDGVGVGKSADGDGFGIGIEWNNQLKGVHE